MLGADTQGIPATLIIVGPTAVGKSRLALALAQEIGAEIVSADSMQVYRGMDIGTAKPTAAEQKIARHHGVDIKNPDQGYSVGTFLKDARAALHDIYERGKKAIVVGGAGFYLQALCQGFEPVSAYSPPEQRKQIIDWVDQNPPSAWKNLAARAPFVAATISPNDRYRIARALEVMALTGGTMAAQARQNSMEASPFLMVCLRLSPGSLQKQIVARTNAMISDGLVAEVEQLLAQGYAETLPAFKAIGYRETIRYLRGGKTGGLSHLKAQIILHTRQLSKRQYTWFRKFERDWPKDRFYWLDVDTGASVNEILKIPGLRQRLHYC